MGLAALKVLHSIDEMRHSDGLGKLDEARISPQAQRLENPSPRRSAFGEHHGLRPIGLTLGLASSTHRSIAATKCGEIMIALSGRYGGISLAISAIVVA